ncbi:branched-chain amino acid ABC transporter permease [Terasakiella pusilla]|uniref:branched-chain amino acid ABC transporter permease n=1 Tax=Terasakiella pusilla TaxID=64973 RepID=UPI003AA99BFD
MTTLLFLEQTLNGLQQGVMLFLMAAGLTLVFGIMHLLNLAHGSLYTVGAYVCATVTQASGSFLIGLACALGASAATGMVIEVLAMRRLYNREHLDQVLATFGIILFFNELVKILWGPQALFLNPPDFLNGTIEVLPDTPYPTYRLFIIATGLVVALGLRHLILNTRVGMLIRAGATHREMVGALGVNIDWLYTIVFGLGAMLAGLAGALAGPMLAIQVGMGENILILTFVVIIVGGVGSIRGALVGALLVGLVDTYVRAFLPMGLREVLEPASADSIGAAISGMGIYILMAVVLLFKPNGLFQAYGDN